MKLWEPLSMIDIDNPEKTLSRISFGWYSVYACNDRKLNASCVIPFEPNRQQGNPYSEKHPCMWHVSGSWRAKANWGWLLATFEGKHAFGPVWLRGSHSLLISPFNPLFLSSNTSIMVNQSTDHEKQPARPYKCPYPLCGRAFSRLEHQVPFICPLTPLSSLIILDEAHTYSYRRKTLRLHLSILWETLFSLRRAHSSLSHTQQWSSSPPPFFNIF